MMGKCVSRKGHQKQTEAVIQISFKVDINESFISTDKLHHNILIKYKIHTKYKTIVNINTLIICKFNFIKVSNYLV